MNHTPHILASVFLCGLWLPIWILAALTDNQPWHCQFCGFSDATHYLANPGLHEREKQEALQRAEIKRETSIDRGDTTFQEKIAYFIDDHKKELLAVGGGAGLLAVLIIGMTYITNDQTARLKAATNSQPSPSSSVSPFQQRIDFAQTFANKNVVKMKDLHVSADGSDYKNLTIVSTSIDDKFVQQFRNDPLRNELRRLGFTNVRISNRQKEWTLSL